MSDPDPGRPRGIPTPSAFRDPGGKRLHVGSFLRFKCRILTRDAPEASLHPLLGSWTLDGTQILEGCRILLRWKGCRILTRDAPEASLHPLRSAILEGCRILPEVDVYTEAPPLI